MKICVLGAGVVGVSTAFALSRIGHDVDVIERAEDVASGASHANGAQLSWSHTDPLANPSLLGKIPAYMLGFDPAMRIRPALKPNFIMWGASFLRHCSPARFKKGKQARDELAQESKDALAGFERDLNSGPLQKTGAGKIVLAQTTAQQRTMMRSPHYRTAEQCVDIEPALKSWSKHFYGGLYAADDRAMDTVLFCHRLMDTAREEFGAKFNFEETVQSLSVTEQGIKKVTTDSREIECDAVIVCLGNQTNALLRSLGLSVPICSVRGYSVTLPATPFSPKASLTDLSHKIVFANLGDRVRIAGFADINVPSAKMTSRVAKLIEIARRCWPDVADYEADPSAWTGARPMTPSGIPVIGPTSIPGLFVNAGHGSLGYTFAAGSALRIADQIGAIQ